jgi:hypothetical protein
MNAETVAQWLNALSLAERAKFLNLVSFRLTIHAREYGLPSTDQSSAAKKLLGININDNELQYKLLSQAGHYLGAEEKKVYPVDVFSRILTETADQHGVAGALAAAIEYGFLSYCGKTPVLAACSRCQLKFLVARCS